MGWLAGMANMNDPMSLALGLAEKARWHCPPNPAVGCVLLSSDGRVLGRGQTQPVGQAHAEVMALRMAQQLGHDTRGATAYVTLEPCAHHGRTGPCCDALIAAGVQRVVVSCVDPNPRVAGQGVARLRAAGVDVRLGEGAERARALNVGFFKRMETGWPWVRLKVAGSLDGRTALPNGVSQWITGPEAREDGQRWRARACAVLTGSGTVLRDNPLLNVRLPGVTRQPLLAVLDSRLQTPPDAALWQVPERAVRLYATDAAAPERWQRLQQLGAQIQQYPADAQETVPLAEVLRDLARHEVNEVHVEAGARLNGALWQAGLVDELLLYQAPMLLGEGAPLAQLPMRHELDGAPRLQLIELTQVGPDVRIRAQKPPR